MLENFLTYPHGILCTISRFNSANYVDLAYLSIGLGEDFFEHSTVFIANVGDIFRKFFQNFGSEILRFLRVVERSRGWWGHGSSL